MSAVASAMRLHSPGSALRCEKLTLRPPGAHEILIDVAACGVCRTDLHLLDGELPSANYP